MIDDLVLQGITEPYRMLTARAEYRLRLRADNAATRLTPLAMAMGCLSPARRDWFVSRETQRTALRDALERKVTGSALAELGLDVREPGQKQSLFEWMRFMALGQEHISALCPEAATCSKAIIDELAEDARYAPYIARQEAEIREMRANDSISLQMVDFTAVPGLSNEMVERLNAARPATLGAAERVRGITPAALAAILVQAKRRAA
jgi:tRNA uridine 5-carboxymethylaminomethyl modification enzyme